MAALEKGLELPPFPPNLVNDPEVPEPSVPSEPGNSLKTGLIILGIGFGTAFVFSWKYSAIVIGIGAAYLVYYVIEGRKREAGKNGPAK